MPLPVKTSPKQIPYTNYTDYSATLQKQASTKKTKKTTKSLTSSDKKSTTTTPTNLPTTPVKIIEQSEAPVVEEPHDYIEEIFGANKINKEIVLFVRWKNSGKTSWISAKTVGLVEPEKLITFYESKIKFELLSHTNTTTEINTTTNTDATQDPNLLTLDK